MFYISKNCCILMASLMLSGCIGIISDMSTYNRDYIIDEDYKLERDKYSGLVLVSVTKSHDTGEARFYFNDENGRRVGFVDSLTDQMESFFQLSGNIRIREVDTSPRRYGQFFVMRLLPGNYYVTRLNYVRYNSDLSPPWTFKVVHGEVSYIGNINLNVNEIKAPIWKKLVADEDPRPVILDRERRDVSLMNKHFPQLNNVTIKKRLLKPSSWRNPMD